MQQNTAHVIPPRARISDLWTRGVGHFTGVGRVHPASWQVSARLPLAPALRRTGRVLEVVEAMLAVAAVASRSLSRVLRWWGRRGRWRRWRRRRRRGWRRWGPRGGLGRGRRPRRLRRRWVVGGRWAGGPVGRRPSAPVVRVGLSGGRFSSVGRRRRPPLWRGMGVAGCCGVQLG